MNEKNLKVRVTSGILAGLMVISVGVVGFAANTKTANSTKNKPQTTQQNGKMDQKVDFKTKLAELVTAGSITQAQADLVTAIMPEGRGDRGDRGDRGGQPPADSTQTKLTAEEMQAKMAEQVAKQKAELTSALTDAVANGAITQAKSDELVTYLDAKDAERKAQMEANKDKKPEDFKKDSTDVKQKGDVAQGQFGSAVTDGIITADQAKAINDILRAKQEAARSEATLDELAKIVTAGTITQAQADKVIATLDTEKTAKIAEQEKIAAMTETERKTYFEANKTERVKPLASLITDGTLTQELADTILKAIMQDNGFGRNGGGHGMGRDGEFKAPNGTASTSAVVQ